MPFTIIWHGALIQPQCIPLPSTAVRDVNAGTLIGIAVHPNLAILHAADLHRGYRIAATSEYVLTFAGLHTA